MSINAPAGDDTTDLDALLKGLADDSTSDLVSGDALLAELMNNTEIDGADCDALLKGLVDDGTSGLVNGDALLAELMNSTDIDALLSGLPGGDTGADEAQQA